MNLVITEGQFLERVKAAIALTGCTALQIGPHATRRGAFKEVYGPSVSVHVRPDMSHEQLHALTETITRSVPGITEVVPIVKRAKRNKWAAS